MSIKKMFENIEETYRRIVETTEEGIWIGDPHGKTFFVNQKMADMLGYTREEMIGKIGLEFLEVGRRDLLKTKDVLKESTSIQREYKFHRKDGGVIWMNVNASPLFDEKGKYIGNLCMHTDITERKRLEEALARAKDELELKVSERTSELVSANQKLQQSEQHIQNLFEVMAEGVVYLTAEGKIIELNAAARKILGLGNISLKNYRYKESNWKLWSPEYDTLRVDGTSMPPEERTIVRAMKERKTIKNTEIGIRRSDGSVIWLNTSAAPLLNKAGKLLGIVGTFIDVTERKKLRDEREQFTQKLMIVQEEERKRISRELHDDTAQYLALLTLELDSIIEKGRMLPPEAISRLQKLRGTAEKALQEVRRFSHELRPSVLEHFGLAAALELIISEFNSVGEIKVSFSVIGSEKRLPDDTELVLFRIAQEALSNIRKHSQATTASVRLRYTLNTVRLTITDDGKGFNVSQKRASGIKGGLGIVGMGERAQLIGATLRIKSRIESGTTVSVEVPCPTNPS